jgi:hypothetical protein
MRPLVIVLVLLAAPVAYADDGAGSYDVKYQEASNDCTNYQTLRAGTLKIDIKKGTLTINIDTIPLLVGVPQKTGKIQAKSKLGPSVIQGADAQYSAGGRIGESGMLELVLSAEYSVKGKALCTQAWNVAGIRQEKKK